MILLKGMSTHKEDGEGVYISLSETRCHGKTDPLSRRERASPPRQKLLVRIATNADFVLA